ncbi:four helix bundle protein [Pontibacter russatus]|uniref:four helix bundle protein n=1 Tax=Pontibacter russatus TaxID=2694929 RepID=UPI001379B3D2|nr:four helix bundle protein [Pontibacter russatus]
MINGKENVLYAKAYASATRVVKAHQYLGQEKREFVLAKQLLRSGTSIGANVAEANGAISDAEFSAKLSIAYKGCLETKYWLDLLKDTNFNDEKQDRSLYADADELGRMLFASIRKVRGIRTDK